MRAPKSDLWFASRLGFWSATGVAVLDAVYVGTGVVWLCSGGFRSPEPLQPAEPYLTLLELLLFFSILFLVGVAGAIHAGAPPERKAGALVSVAFMTSFATLTAAVHFARLVVARDLPGDATAELAVLRLYPWPSIALAVELLAWDLFLGLALLLAAPAIEGGRLATAARAGVRLAGALCVLGFLGPLTGEMRIQYLAIAGYAFVLPVTCALFSLRFRDLAREP